MLQSRLFQNAAADFFLCVFVVFLTLRIPPLILVILFSAPLAASHFLFVNSPLLTLLFASAFCSVLLDALTLPP